LGALPITPGDGASAAPKSKKGLLAAVRQAIPIGLRQSVTRCLPRHLRYKLSMKWVNSGIDWTQSKVFCIPNSNEGYFRINLKGREPQGIVSSGSEYEDLLGRLSSELEQLENPQNGMRAADRVSLMDSTYPGPRRPDLPDAVISWNLDARVLGEIAAPTAGRIQKPPGYMISPFYTGNHRPTAFVLAGGPDWQASAGPANGDILDIAPTVLALLGVDVPDHFEGRPWTT